jgi:hypothetical protein
LGYITAILYILWPFGNSGVIWYTPILVYCIKKNLATLLDRGKRDATIRFDVSITDSQHVDKIIENVDFIESHLTVSRRG